MVHVRCHLLLWWFYVLVHRQVLLQFSTGSTATQVYCINTHILVDSLSTHVVNLSFDSIWHFGSGYGAYLTVLTMMVLRARYIKKQSTVYLYKASMSAVCNKELFIIEIPLAHYCQFSDLKSS